jgi:hypothetical protein
MIRLRAEVLLDRIDDASKRPVTVTDDEREELARIASAPQLADRDFLQRFDVIYEEDDDEG